MGTNYYLHTNICSHCGKGDEPLHIGKSSAGWVFALHVYPEDGISSLMDWKSVLANGTIRDEYGKDVSYSDMMRTIEGRKKYGDPPTPEFLRENHAIAGSDRDWETRTSSP